MKNIYILLLSVLTIISCEKEMMSFEGKDSVYFKVQPRTSTGVGNPEIWPVVDTSSISFTKTTEPDSIYLVKVRLLGRVKDYDRKFKILVDTGTTATSGVDYDELLEYYVMKAGERDSFIPIKFHRTEIMQEKDLFLTLSLHKTEDFDLILPIYNTEHDQTPDTVKINVINHTIIVSDKIFKPITWNDYVGGTYSDYKMTLICDLYDVPIEEFANTDTMPFTRFKSMMIAFNLYLLQMKIDGNTVYEQDLKGNYTLDEDGKKIEMTTGPGLPN